MLARLRRLSLRLSRLAAASGAPLTLLLVAALCVCTVGCRGGKLGSRMGLRKGSPAITSMVSAPSCDMPACDAGCTPIASCEAPCIQPGCDVPVGCVAGGCVTGGCDGCGTGACGVGGCGVAPNPNAKKFSDAWWADRAMDPPGQRQVCKFGKKWPVQPRPTGRKQRLIHRYHTAHAWPHPYVCADRSAVEVTAAMTRQGGWDEISTLHMWHFDDATGDLNGVGRQHLHYLVSHAPMHSQSVFVARGTDGDVAARLASVEQAIVEMTGDSARFAVLPREAYSTTRPATETESIYRGMLEAMPAPILSEMAQGNGGGGAPVPAPQ